MASVHHQIGEGFDGMSDLIRGLAKMGETVQVQAAGIVRSTAQLMQAAVRAKYRSRTGTLRARVSIEERPSTGGGASLRWKVRSRAPHAHLYEQGTVERFLARNGASRGRMPASPVFVPEAVIRRERMNRELIALVARQTVPGMTGRLEVRQS